MQVLNLSLAYAITFLASNVPYVTFELIIALDKQDNMGPIMAALFGNMYITIHEWVKLENSKNKKQPIIKANDVSQDF